VMPASTSTTHKVFVGVTTRHNEPAGKKVFVQTTGPMLARVKGGTQQSANLHIEIGDKLCLEPGENYLVKEDDSTSGAPIVGEARERITEDKIKLIQIMAPSGGGGDGGLLQFKRQFDPDATYQEDDIVICKETTELDEGRQGGTFIATAPVQPGDMHPGMELQTAQAHATLGVGGSIGFVIIDDGGYGYDSNQELEVVVTDASGSGAVLEANVSDSEVVSVTIVNGGSGYVDPTIEIGIPSQTQKWYPFALGAWAKLSLRPQNQERENQLALLDAGRDAAEVAGDTARGKPRLLLMNDLDDAAAGRSYEGLAQIPQRAIDYGNGAADIQLREWTVCVNGVFMNVLIKSGLPYPTVS
jgi:hypothetical protein